MMETKFKSAADVPDLGHRDGVSYTIDEKTDALLTALASIVVDEIIRLRDMGMTPDAIMRMYAEDIQPPPSVPTRKRRTKKEGA